MQDSYEVRSTDPFRKVDPAMWDLRSTGSESSKVFFILEKRKRKRKAENCAEKKQRVDKRVPAWNPEKLHLHKYGVIFGRRGFVRPHHPHAHFALIDEFPPGQGFDFTHFQRNCTACMWNHLCDSSSGKCFFFFLDTLPTSKSTLFSRFSKIKLVPGT